LTNIHIFGKVVTGKQLVYNPLHIPVNMLNVIIRVINEMV